MRRYDNRSPFKVDLGRENEIINNYANLLRHNPLILEVEKRIHTQKTSNK